MMGLQTANFATAADVLDGWRDDVLSGRPPRLFPIGDGDLARLEVGPGLVNLIGGAPGAGKTAFTMQAAIDALRLTPTLRVVVCNIEMPPAVLLDRQLARLSGVDLTTIRYRRLEERHAERIEAGLATLEELADRLCFVRPPFGLANVAAAADAFFAPGGDSLIVLDYIQRISPPGEHGDRRGAVDATMNSLRQFADAGVAVIVVSAVGRSKDKAGRNAYGVGLNLASFRESSELEFGADSAFILTPDAQQGEGAVRLLHLKDRHGECRDLLMHFDKPRQAFRLIDAPDAPATMDPAKLADLWNATDAACPEPAEGAGNEESDDED
jgi:replicative DNA helicase